MLGALAASAGDRKSENTAPPLQQQQVRVRVKCSCTPLHAAQPPSKARAQQCMHAEGSMRRVTDLSLTAATTLAPSSKKKTSSTSSSHLQRNA